MTKAMLSVVALLALSYQASVFAAKIDQQDLKPDATIEVAVPELGGNWQSKGKDPVRLFFMLPSNYDAKQSHPVFVVLPGKDGSTLVDQMKRWRSLFENKNVIIVGVEYEASAGWASGAKHAAVGLKLINKATKIDKQGIGVGGSSSGAYSVCDLLEKGGAISSTFSVFVPVIGGDDLDPRLVGRRSILWVSGENDNQKATAGKPRNQAQKNAHEALRKAGVDSTLIVQEGVGHHWADKADEQIRQWFYEKFPPFKSSWNLAKRLEKAPSDAARLSLQRQIAKEWLDLPWINDAKAAVEAAENQAKSDK